MSVPVDIEIVKRARAKIEDPHHWCMGMGWQKADGSPAVIGDEIARYCAWGAILSAAHELIANSNHAEEAAIRIALKMAGEIEDVEDLRADLEKALGR